MRRKTPQGLLSGKHEMFDAGKSRRAELQGRKVIAAPKTRQSLLSGEHKMFDAGKFRRARIAGAQSDCCAENSAEPVVRGA